MDFYFCGVINCDTHRRISSKDRHCTYSNGIHKDRNRRPYNHPMGMIPYLMVHQRCIRVVRYHCWHKQFCMLHIHGFQEYDLLRTWSIGYSRTYSYGYQTYHHTNPCKNQNLQSWLELQRCNQVDRYPSWSKQFYTLKDISRCITIIGFVLVVLLLYKLIIHKDTKQTN